MATESLARGEERCAVAREDKPDIRILIADDHRVVCFGLRGIIHTQRNMRVVVEARNGRDAVAAFREHRPDVTLMDLRMPEMSGVDAIRAIRKEYKKQRLYRVDDLSR